MGGLQPSPPFNAIIIRNYKGRRTHSVPGAIISYL